MSSHPVVPLASLFFFAVVAGAAFGLGGCYVEVGTDGEDEETEEVEAVDAPEEESTCDVSACDTFCNLGGDCNYDAVDAANCVTDCLDACDDGFSDEEDAVVMDCMTEQLGDVWCETGLLDKCCAEVDAWSDLCG